VPSSSRTEKAQNFQGSKIGKRDPLRDGGRILILIRANCLVMETGRQVRNLLVGSSVGKLRVTEKIESRHYLFLKVELLLSEWKNQLSVLGMYSIL
jgi:hypothetical protein